MTPATTGPMFRPVRGNIDNKPQPKQLVLAICRDENLLKLLELAEITYLHLEVVEGMLVDVFHLLPQSHGVVSQRGDVRTAFLVVGGVVEARGRHVSGADGFDLL